MFLHSVFQFPLGSFRFYLFTFFMVYLVVFFRFISILAFRTPDTTFINLSLAHAVLLYRSTSPMLSSLYSCSNSIPIRYFLFHIIEWYYSILVLNILLSRTAIYSWTPLVVSHVSLAHKTTGLMTILYNVIFLFK